MNELDVFIVAFGIAFFVASDRFKQVLSLMGLRRAQLDATAKNQPGR